MLDALLDKQLGSALASAISNHAWDQRKPEAPARKKYFFSQNYGPPQRTVSAAEEVRCSAIQDSLFEIA